MVAGCSPLTSSQAFLAASLTFYLRGEPSLLLVLPKNLLEVHVPPSNQVYVAGHILMALNAPKTIFQVISQSGGQGGQTIISSSHSYVSNIPRNDFKLFRSPAACQAIAFFAVPRPLTSCAPKHYFKFRCPASKVTCQAMILSYILCVECAPKNDFNFFRRPASKVVHCNDFYMPNVPFSDYAVLTC
ncbi:hypothetical protein B0H10DRAFT_1944319 [Mycena sp. CBHHK59/15]|nr:hypothetical protein B0H10DRAFT_1944319 [Mycena sp. CBHHK59/15]